MTRKENTRAAVLTQALADGRINAEVAQALGVSVRQVQRMKKAMKEDGPAALAHGNRGKKASHALEEDTSAHVVELYRSKYKGFNFSHFHEKLIEEEQLDISLSSVARVLKKAGFTSPRKRRPPKHRSRRERRSREGAMLQLDGSPHDWLEGRGPKLCLVGAIDDATSKVVGAIFRENEDAHGYFLVMKQVLRKYGIPEAVYHDRHGIFEREIKSEETLWEQLEGKSATTQFGRLMEELVVQQISANSPQAKGRIERLWGTFQDRLVSELRFAGASTLEEANAVLERVIREHNRRFCRRADDPQSAFRKPEKGLDMDNLFCFKYRRSVAKDNTISLFGRAIQISPGPGGRSYSGCSVEVQQKFDGSLHILYQGSCITKTPAMPSPPTSIRVRAVNGTYIEECPQTSSKDRQQTKEIQIADDKPKQRNITKPAANHPWKKSFKVT